MPRLYAHVFQLRRCEYLRVEEQENQTLRYSYASDGGCPLSLSNLQMKRRLPRMRGTVDADVLTARIRNAILSGYTEIVGEEGQTDGG